MLPAWLIIAFQSDLHPADMVAISNRRLDFCFEVGFLVVHNILLLYCIIHAQIMLALKYSGVGWIKPFLMQGNLTPLVRSYQKPVFGGLLNVHLLKQSKYLVFWTLRSIEKVINWKLKCLLCILKSSFYCSCLLYLRFVSTICKAENTMALPMAAWSQVLVQLEAGIGIRRQHRMQFLHSYIVFCPAPSGLASFLGN